MDRNLEFINNVKVSDIPWHRLATTYGRASDFPECLRQIMEYSYDTVDKGINHIAMNIEHQSTLWYATPYTVIFLIRSLKKLSGSIRVDDISRYAAENIMDLLLVVAESIKMVEEHACPVPLDYFEDMLSEEYLWSEEFDKEEDEMRYEEEGGPFPERLFYSFYHFSRLSLASARPLFEELAQMDGEEIKLQAENLLTVI